MLKSMDDSQVRSELPKRISLPKSPEASQPTSEVSDADDGMTGRRRVLEDAIGEDSNTQRKDLLKLNEVRKFNGRDEIEKLGLFNQYVGRESLKYVRKVC